MDSTFLFLPEMILIASILAIPAIYIATESTKSYSICSNISLFVSLLLVVLFWYYPDDVSFDKSSSSYIIYDHFTYIGPPRTLGWASLMIVILIIGGFQMLMLGVIGEYIWRTLSQARGRPQYMIEEVIE